MSQWVDTRCFHSAVQGYVCLTQRKIIARMNSARVPVKKSSRSLKVSRKRLGTGEDVQIVDHSTPA